ncbi:MAG: 3-phosphoshikimate 1-carboxyvinyltransferase [Rhodothermales bacterium]|nr:3-phosphoshikimate 1-carboxyvinyltransferase [Rhodothermales bacterium]
MTPVGGLAGAPSLPGDKSIAHRAAILAAIADGDSILANFPESADPQSTLSVLGQLGVPIVTERDGVHVEGVGIDGLVKPETPLDCGNSGTTMRLMAGVLSGCPFESTLVGDESLSQRPMNRIADPLRKMGARVDLVDGLPPVTIVGGNLKPIDYDLPVASAQVKSCILLAGLSVDEPTTVFESIQTRDHTERMLGLDSILIGGKRAISSSSGDRPGGRTWVIPKDFSAAAFFLAAGSIIPNSKLVLQGVGINPTRTGLLTVLRAMGAELTVINERSFSGENIADIGVESAPLHGLAVSEEIVPNIIDELPILAVAATQASGTTIVRGAGELRVKESDRIHAIVSNLTILGADITEHEDGFEIHGPTRLRGGHVDSFNDHRIAMVMSIAGLVADGQTVVRGGECADVSFPGFLREIENLSVEKIA